LKDKGVEISRQTSSDSHRFEPGNVEYGSGKRMLLIFIAFMAGAAVMIMELAANRILAPWFGNSLFNWTGLIGIILIALSLGYYAGGWLADLRGDYQTLAHLLAAAAGTILFIPLAHSLVGTRFQDMDPILGPLLASTMLFALPGVLLGSLSPYIIRLMSQLSGDRQIGMSAGTIFMFSTLGSVIGTFSAGFFFIPHVHLDTIFVLIGGSIMTLALAGYVFLARKELSFLSIFLCIFNIVLLVLSAVQEPGKDSAVLYDKTNFYHRIRVLQKKVDNGDRMISLYMDTAFQGAQYDRSFNIPSRCQRFWALSRIFCPHLERAVFLGGGALVMPEALLRAYPSSAVEVIEIDPELLEVGRRFFKMAEYPQLTMIPDDARRYLRLTDKKYDLIFGDVYHGLRTVPAHLITREFFTLVRDRLRERGVYMMNLIGTIQGPHASSFRSTLHTLQAVFKHTYVFAIEPTNLRQVQNIIIAATDAEISWIGADRQKFEKDPLAGLLISHYISKENYDLAGASLITDYHNPIEYLAAKSLYSTNN
jgi:spermidine synthase